MATAAYRPRRTVQLTMVWFGQAIGYGAYVLTSLNRTNTLPGQYVWVAIVWFGLGLLTHLVVALRLPYADPLLLPVVFALAGIGLAEIHRIDLARATNAATTQGIALIVGLVISWAVVLVLRNPSRLKGFPFLLSALGLVLLLLPLVPHLGVSVNGSSIWIRLGGVSFQPAELAKIVLAASFAAYLTDKREVLSLAGRRFIGLDLPRMRDLGPIVIMWGVALAIMVFENDLGTSLLFFGLFVAVIYVATGKVSWVILGLVLFAGAGFAVFRFVPHAIRRLNFWLHPFNYPDTATQIIQAQFGLSHGGLLGSGWGLGRPTLTIFASSDMIAAALGEEIGLTGLFAIIVLYAIFVFRGLKAASASSDPFLSLFATGLSFAFLLQTFAIIGGVTRLLPLTGLTTPFLSQGGSSMIANWLLVAILLVISHHARRPAVELGPTTGAGAADFASEATQVISARELAKIGIGDIHPVQRLDAPQVPVEAPTPESTDGTAPTVSIPPTSTAEARP